jgi:hypothetical protein
MNPATCEVCPVLDFNFGFSLPYESLILPNGDILVSTINGTFRFDPPSNIPVAILPEWFQGAYIHPDGTIYISSFNFVTGVNSFLTFNPTTNTFTTIGNFPSGYFVQELFFFNGQLYGMDNNTPNPSSIIQINTTNPSASTVVQIPPLSFFSATSMPNGGPIYMTSWSQGIGLGTYDFTTNSITPNCPPPFLYLQSLSVAPPGVPEQPCVCLSSAAGMPAITTINACLPNSIFVPFTAAQPDFNDIVRYIIYSNPASPLTSIIQTSTIPDFNFAPPLVSGTNYYVAQLVGNDLNGSVDLADPCLKISTATTVIWRPKPTLVSLSQSGDLCPGACADVTITLSGNPPFSYSWAMQQGGNFITPLSTTSNINTNPSVFQACVPASALPGAVSLQMCGITDAYCTNP